MVDDGDSSFGISEVVDCRLGTDGKRIYKIKWEATWESEEQLAGCQRLIDAFWTKVNNAGTAEDLAAEQARKRIRLTLTAHSGVAASLDQYRMTESDRNDIQALLSRTDANIGISSPSKMLGEAIKQENVRHMNQVLTNPCAITSNASQGKTTSNSIAKQEGDESKAKSASRTSASSSGASNLSVIDSFDNPYVKIVLVCKICNKEQHMKRPADWKKHYFTHASNEDKPYKCDVCGKGFAQSGQQKSHMKTHMKSALKDELAWPPQM